MEFFAIRSHSAACFAYSSDCFVTGSLYTQNRPVPSRLGLWVHSDDFKRDGGCQHSLLILISDLDNDLAVFGVGQGVPTDLRCRFAGYVFGVIEIAAFLALLIAEEAAIFAQIEIKPWHSPP